MKKEVFNFKKIVRKVVIGVFAIGMLGFVSCNDDDDDVESGNDDCETCTFTEAGVDFTSDFCDNGDGTITIIVEGQEEVQDLEGVTFDQFIEAYELLLGATCN